MDNDDYDSKDLRSHAVTRFVRIAYGRWSAKVKLGALETTAFRRPPHGRREPGIEQTRAAGPINA